MNPKKFSGLLSRFWFLLKFQWYTLTGQKTTLEQWCRTRLSQQPTEYLATLCLAQTLRRQQQWTEAAALYERLIELSTSRSFMDILDFVTALYQAQHYANVIVTGENALNALAYSRLGLEQGLRVFYYESIHRLIGLSFAAQGEFAKAIPHLEEAVRRPNAADRETLQHLLETCRQKVK